MEFLEDVLTDHVPPFDLEFACHDCGAPTRVTYSEDEGGGRLDPQDGAAGYNPTLNNGSTEYFVKCPECFEKNPQLRSFNPIEVYTRVVGYYRPITSFNKGKMAEYQDRKYYSQEAVE